MNNYKKGSFIRKINDFLRATQQKSYLGEKDINTTTGENSGWYLQKFIRLLPDTNSIPDLYIDSKGLFGLKWHTKNFYLSLSINNYNILKFIFINFDKKAANLKGQFTFTEKDCAFIFNLLKKEK